MIEQEQSFKAMKLVPADVIQDRLERVRLLKEDALELYEIAKDRSTGEHYLHYAYVHRSFTAVGPGAGAEESFHHLMPLDSDDVLGILFSDQPYDYPAAWDRSFLRNGPEGAYVWFDPGYARDEEESEAAGQDIVRQLQAFKTAGDLSEEAVRRLLEGTHPNRLGNTPDADKDK